VTLDCWRSSHCHRGSAGWLPLVFAALAGVAYTGTVAAAEPKGTPLNDPELAALLRPSDPIVAEHLTRAEDGYVYYSAKLKHFALPGFTKRYLAELEDRGVRFRPLGSSPHAPPQRIIGYDVLAWQEVTVDPFTIRFREGKDREETIVPEPPLRPDYHHPVSVTLDRLVVRLPAEFARPWTTAVVVPREDQATLPFSIPLPPDAVVRAAWKDRADEWGPNGPQKGRVLADVIGFISRLTPTEICEFYRRALSGWGSPKIDEPNRLIWSLGPLPPWAPAQAESVWLDTTSSTLFATPGGMGVRDFATADTFERKTLPHLPRGVRNYVVWVHLRAGVAK
jgi:hypothetical protein